MKIIVVCSCNRLEVVYGGSQLFCIKDITGNVVNQEWSMVTRSCSVLKTPQGTW